MFRAAAAAVLVSACMTEAPTVETPPVDTSEVESAATVCGAGPTVKGIDVSYYQGTIDWAKVKAAGVQYAFIRVSDGANFQDPKFASYWAGARGQGILRGAYQFFRPGQDPIAQADLLLSKMGPLMPDDLPPVIDVEAADGKTPAQIAAGVRKWVAHVKAAIGRDPIIYTGFYFWRDSVGAANITTSPLWHAQYTSAQCPNISPPWTDWAFWQYTSSGSVNGIGGNVDTNRFNGTRGKLLELTVGPRIGCEPLGPDGGTIDDGDPCFMGGGPAASLRHVATAGEGGDLVWTHATEDADEANFGEWKLELTQAGRYRVEVYTDAKFAKSKRAKYSVRAAGTTHDVMIDQTAVDGWQSLGELEFAAGGDQVVHLADNTGEKLADNVQLAFDAVRLTPVAEEPPPDSSDATGGCSTGGGGGWAIGLALAGLVRRRGSRATR